MRNLDEPVHDGWLQLVRNHPRLATLGGAVTVAAVGARVVMAYRDSHAPDVKPAPKPRVSMGDKREYARLEQTSEVAGYQ